VILSELISYLADQRRATLMDLSNRLGSDPETLRGMLTVLERKGRARKFLPGSTCGGGCSKCDPASIEIYEWVGTGGERRNG